MTKYLLIYHGGGAMPEDPAAVEKEMAAWGSWLGSLGEAVADGGNPVGRAWTISADGTTEDAGPNPCTGYGILSAESMDAALVLAKGCPHLASGGTIELCETFDVGG